MKIDWSARARTDLEDLQAYISKDSPYYARRFIAKIIASVELLADQPRMGRRVPEASRDDIRELIYRNYRIIYLVKSDRVYIVTVLHGSRDLTRQETKPWNIV